jgi:hypothetical protein
VLAGAISWVCMLSYGRYRWCEKLAQVGGTHTCGEGEHEKLLTGGRPPYVKHEMVVAGFEPASGDEVIV